MPIIISVPGSKSITNRALVLAALCKGQVKIVNTAVCDDTKYMIKGLKKLGLQISQNGSTIKIKGSDCKFPQRRRTVKIYTGNAGTTTRFLTALATLTGNKVTIAGDKRMQERPIEALCKALNQLGASVQSANGYPPIKISPRQLQGGTVELPGNISSQYVSAILLIAPFIGKPTTLKIVQKLYSKPYVQLTIDLLKQCKIKTSNKNFKQFGIGHGTSKISLKNTFPKLYKVAADASSAAYIGAFAALHSEKPLLLQGISQKSTQGDIKFLQYLAKMGCKIIEKQRGILIKGPQRLKPLGIVDMNETPDLVMIFAVLAAFANRTSKIINISNLRIKETDRIQALENELKKIGAKVRTGQSWIEIVENDNKPQRKITIETYNDHRIAMAFGIAQTVLPYLSIKNPSCVSKSYTTFWDDLEKCKTAKS